MTPTQTQEAKQKYFGDFPNANMMFDILKSTYERKGFSGLVDLVLAINVQGLTVNGKNVFSEEGLLKKIAIIKDLIDVLQMFNISLSMFHAKLLVWGYVQRWNETKQMTLDIVDEMEKE